MRAPAGLTVVALLAALTTSPAAAAADTCPVELPRRTNGQAALEALGPDLARAADQAGMGAASLRQQLRTDPTLWVDTCGRPYFVEPVTDVSERTFEPALVTTGDPLRLHSRPGSNRTIHLDFDGYEVTAEGWVEEGDEFTAPGYSRDDDPAFDAGELARIADVWLRVAEDYAPFNVDVTTEDPGDAAIDRSSLADQVYGTRVAIVGPNPIYDWCGCGGIAYVNVFDTVGDHDVFQPAFVFTDGVGTGSKNIAEAASHEAGHNLGLSHDGAGTSSYYRGQGLWAPIMGVGYYEPLTQWSKGEYRDATRTEDDLAIIAANGTPFTADDVGGSAATATEITPGTVSGVIGTRSDTDWFRFTASGGTTLTVTPQAVSPDLDVRIDLYDEDGELLASADPVSAQLTTDTASGLGASISQVLSSGTYYLSVDGVGSGDPLVTGYTDYASLGRYDLVLTTAGPPTLMMTRQVLPQATVGTAYEAAFTATGGTPPYTFAIGSGTLPSGMSLSSDGQLSGTPTSAGIATFTVRVTDSVAATSDTEFSLTVKALPGSPPSAPPVTASPSPVTPTPTPTPTPTQTPTVTPAPTVQITTDRRLPRATVGKRYTTRLKGVNAASWRVSAGKAPKGLRLTSEGRLTGRAKKAGRYSFTVTATGSAGQTETAVFTLRVRRPAR